MCIVPFGTIYMLFNIDMGKRRQVHAAYSPSIVLAMRK